MVENNTVRLNSLHGTKINLAVVPLTELEHYSDLIGDRLEQCERDLNLIGGELGRRMLEGEVFPELLHISGFTTLA